MRYGCAAPNNLSQGYCPTSRKVAFTGNADGPPDFIGIYIRYTTNTHGAVRIDTDDHRDHDHRSSRTEMVT